MRLPYILLLTLIFMLACGRVYIPLPFPDIRAKGMEYRCIWKDLQGWERVNEFASPDECKRQYSHEGKDILVDCSCKKL